MHQDTMRDVLILGAVRQRSCRVPDKMLRRFGDTTLFDIFIKKLVELNESKHLFNRVVLAVCKSDEMLWKKATDSGLEVAERSEHSVSDDAKNVYEIHDYLKNYDEQYVCTVNACFPFLSTDTVRKTCEFFKNNERVKSLSCVRYRYNHFWDAKTYAPINNLDKTCLNTKTINPVLENVNSIVIYNREFMFKNRAYWDYGRDDPYLYVLDESPETLDIDTMMDFMVCESLYVTKKLSWWGERCL